jgi:apolipoprotein N-acyltransferase
LKRAAPRRLEALAALALGALQTLAFVHTAWLWPLPLAALAWLVWRLDMASPSRAALLAWCYGTGWLCAGTWWLFVSMHRYGGLAAPLAVLAVLALAAALSMYMAALGALYARWRRGHASDALVFAALWLLAELARGLIFTGFPWVASGYSQVDSPLAALAPWVGVYGMGAVLAFAAAALVRLLTQRALWPVAAALLLVAVPRLAPSSFTEPAGELAVALLQPNIAQDEKFSLERMPEALAWVATALRQPSAGLVVAPETAVPLLPAQLTDFAPGYWDALKEHFSTPGRAALVGVSLGDLQVGYTNSVAGLSAAPEYRYDKRHLVPFGEFNPPGFRWFTEMLGMPLGDFSRGVERPPSFAYGGQRLAPNICYEDLFGEELARRFADPSTAPTVFVNFSNIGWFGDTVAVPQHLNISRLRALEFQLPMLRATNTGATAFIDHEGRVGAHLQPQTRGVLQGTVQGRQGRTPFARWASVLGLWPLIVAALAVLVLLRPKAAA